jgi:tetratricopeptide (TPR) repeat protein
VSKKLVPRRTKLDKRLRAWLFAGAIALAGCGVNAPAADVAPRIEVTFYPTQTTVPSPTPEPVEVSPSATPSPQKITQASTPAQAATQAQLPTVVPTATALPQLFAPAAPSAYLTGIRHERQTWNNCGPATISMLLSRFGRTDTQREAAQFLKPDKEDKNVSPDELVAYAQSLGYEALAFVGGDMNVLRTLVTNGFPVIVESWFIPEPNDEMGHYQLLIGYDDRQAIFYDSYEGPDLREDIAEFEPLWRVFNNMAVVVWRPEQRPFVMEMLGELSDPQQMHARALEKAQADIAANVQDRFAWFNAGSSLHALGRTDEAAQAFDTAFKLKLPWRTMWYQFAPYAAYYEVGRHDEVIALANATLKRVKNLEESYYWRGRSLAAKGNANAARADFQQALVFNPNFAPAQAALSELALQ